MRTIELFLKLHPKRTLWSSNSVNSRVASTGLLLKLCRPLDITTTIFGYMLHRTLSITMNAKVVKPQLCFTSNTVASYWFKLHYAHYTPVNCQVCSYLTTAYVDMGAIINNLKYCFDTSSRLAYKLNWHHQTQSGVWTTPHTPMSRPKITTSACIRFRKNYSISFLLKPSSTGVYQTIWSCRISCFYRLVAPTYSKIHIKKYKKFLDILSTKVFMYWKSAKPVTNFSVVIPDVLDVIPSRTFSKYSSNTSTRSDPNAINFVGSGLIKLHKDFFYSLKIRRSLPRRIRRKVLSKKVGRLWLN